MSLLKTPVQVGALTLHDRLVMPPMATAKSDENGLVTDALCAYYDEKTASGQIGLVIVEHSFIAPEGRASAGQLSLASDDTVEGLRRLTETIRKNGSKVFAQLNHAGGFTTPEVTGGPLLSASSIIVPGRATTPARAMDADDLAHVVDCFAAAAKRAQAAGFDGVELHSAHGYLLNQFYSPLTNRREDAYTGRTLEGRIRLHLEVIAAVRAAVGADFPIALRLGACDYAEGGSTIADGAAAAAAFERAGVDLIDVSGGFCRYTHPTSTAPGYFADASAAIRAAVSVPVILTGGIHTAREAEALLAAQRADLIGVGRALLTDSDWPARELAAL